MKILTKDDSGKPNGFVVPIWNIHEQPDLRPDQVYLTAVAPHSQKGPHLHKVRRGRFCCIKGNVRVVLREQHPAIGQGNPWFAYKTLYSGEDHDYLVIDVATNVAACIYNDSGDLALVLNMPSPAWRPDAQDEWPVGEWTAAA